MYNSNCTLYSVQMYCVGNPCCSHTADTGESFGSGGLSKTKTEKILGLELYKTKSTNGPFLQKRNFIFT